MRNAIWWAVLFIGLVWTSSAWAKPESGGDGFAEQRASLVRELKDELAEAPGQLPRGAALDAVLTVLGRVPRHLFVPESERGRAYTNRPLPIGYGQTISQPYVVALMTGLLRPQAGQRMLEIGSGSGYQAAMLAELGVQVHSIEIVPELAEQVATRLPALGYEGVRLRQADGYFGWPEAAPFDGIIVTAAASMIPPPLVEQLKPGGRMVIPVGPPFLTQMLVLVEKKPNGQVHARSLLPVLFVPLTGER